MALNFPEITLLGIMLSCTVIGINRNSRNKNRNMNMNYIGYYKLHFKKKGYKRKPFLSSIKNPQRFSDEPLRFHMDTTGRRGYRGWALGAHAPVSKKKEERGKKSGKRRGREEDNVSILLQSQ